MTAPPPKRRAEATVAVDLQGLSPADLAQHSFRDATARSPARPAGIPVIDATAHPRPRPGELKDFLPPLWRDRRLPMGDRYYYPNPVGDWLKDSYPDAAGPPGSDPALLARHVLDEAGADGAILLPLTLGLLPDADLLAAVCAATNAWLAERWLARDPRFKGTIRVAPGNPKAAVAEIEKWAAHPGFVQVGVPMQSMQLYGNAVFLPVWEAAAGHRLPVAFHADAESGVELAPTTVGYLRHFLGYAAYQPITFISHLTSFMTNGVLDHLPELRLVFADGAWEMCAPLIWRLDKDYRPMRGDMPWMRRLPSDYIARHVRFVAHSTDGPDDPTALEEWLGVSDGARTVMYGSNYPAWNLFHPGAAFAGIDASLRARILGGTASELYGLAPAPCTAAKEEAGS